MSQRWSFIQLVCWAALGCLITSCSSVPSEGTGTASKPISEGGSTMADPHDLPAIRPPVVEPPADGDNERPRGEEIRRHPEIEQRHDSDTNYHPPKDLRGIYATVATAELKKIVYQNGERLWKNYGIRDLRLRTPNHTEVGDVDGQKLFDELMEGKHELWERWRAGDKSATLPEFPR